MGRAYNERRNKQVVVLVERRKKSAKEVGRILGITYDNVRKILSLWRRRHLVQVGA